MKTKKKLKILKVFVFSEIVFSFYNFQIKIHMLLSCQRSRAFPIAKKKKSRQKFLQKLKISPNLANPIFQYGRAAGHAPLSLLPKIVIKSSGTKKMLCYS